MSIWHPLTPVNVPRVPTMAAQPCQGQSVYVSARLEPMGPTVRNGPRTTLQVSLFNLTMTDLDMW